MHELSIAMSLVEVAEEEAQRLGSRVVAVHLKLGPLSGVVKEALLSAYELAREGTSLERSQLVVQDMPIVAWCPACGCERTISSMQQMICPVCQAPTPEIRGGRELEVVAMEVLEDDADAHRASPPAGAQAE